MRPALTWASSPLKAKGHGGTGLTWPPGAGLIQAEALPGKESTSVLVLGDRWRVLEFEGASGLLQSSSLTGLPPPWQGMAFCLLSATEGPSPPPGAARSRERASFKGALPCPHLTLI